MLALPIAQSTVSQHLKELRAAELVQGEVDGPRVCYCPDPAGWARARNHIDEAVDPEAKQRQRAVFPAKIHRQQALRHVVDNGEQAEREGQPVQALDRQKQG